VEIHCATLPAHLIEGEQFGHEKGAFTDAQARKPGELDLSPQAKLLCVLENFRVRRLGARQDRLVNVRVVCATNRDLDQLVEAGRLRTDRLYRLWAFQINIPPLRARGDDVLLARRFLAQMAQRHGKPPPRLDASACDALRAHTWPGIVRELRNVVERAVLLKQGQPLGTADLALGPRPAARHQPGHAALPPRKARPAAAGRSAPQRLALFLSRINRH